MRNIFKYEGWHVCRFFLFETELNACTRSKLAGNCLFLNPKKEKDSETYSSFTGIKNIKNQVNEIIPDNNSKKNFMCVYPSKLGG